MPSFRAETKTIKIWSRKWMWSLPLSTHCGYFTWKPQKSAQTVTVHSLTHQRWRHHCCWARPGGVPTLGCSEFFTGAKTGHGEQWGRGWHLELSPRCQLPERVMCQICRQRGRAGVQLGRSPVELSIGGGTRECRHTSDESLYVGRGPQRTKRHKEDRLLNAAKTEGHSGIWVSIHPTMA